MGIFLIYRIKSCLKTKIAISNEKKNKTLSIIMVNTNGRDSGLMRKILITVIMAMLFVMPAQAYTRADFETIYQNETDQNIKEMGIRQLELELGINTDTDKRTVGHFTRSDCDFCTMISLINTKKQTVSGRSETDFTMYLSKDNVYDYAYYKEREKDLDLLVAHIGVVKAMTEGIPSHNYLRTLRTYVS